jgi:hypothetical protein
VEWSFLLLAPPEGFEFILSLPMDPAGRTTINTGTYELIKSAFFYFTLEKMNKITIGLGLLSKKPNGQLQMNENRVVRTGPL